uniref:Myosin motor domain-containing protein n=1 Tax=Bicosoecida sp. CB-2014 TaxID=1486930 RepID=A0A7S1C5C8_9STRA
MAALCRELLASLASSVAFEPRAAKALLADGVRYGRTKLFLRRPLISALDALRDVRLKAMDRMAVKCQALFRGYALRKEMREMWEGFLRLQAAWRAVLYRQAWLRRARAVRVIQRHAKAWLTWRWYQAVKDATVVVQRWFHKQAARLRWTHQRRGLRLFHSLARGWVVRRHVLLMLRAVVTLQRSARDFLVRNRAYWDQVRAVDRKSVV